MADPIRVDALSRRTVLKGLAGAAGLVSIPAIMAACSSPAASTVASAPPAATSAASAPAASAGASTAVGSLTFGSNYSNTDTEEGHAGRRRRVHGQDRHRRSRSTPSTTTRSRTRSAHTSGARRTHVSPGSPATACVLRRPGPRHRPRRPLGEDRRNYSDASKASSTGNDRRSYFIPFDNYPWAVIYRKSVFADKGYTVPKTSRSSRP